MTKTRSPKRAQFLADVLTTAVEGGIGYWSRVTAYRWESPDLGYSDGREGAPDVASAAVSIVEVGDGFVEDDSPRFDVTLDTIARGLRLIREAKPNGEESWGRKWTTIRFLSVGTRDAITKADRTNDAGELDSGLADIVVQVATLGEVRYG